MKNAIVINNTNVSIKEYHGQRVLTFKDIDAAHKRPDGTAGRNFRSNKKHFIESEDFFKIQPDEIRRVGITSPNGGIVLTESGYLMLVKSFTDDLAWDVQRQLVKHYFRGQTEAPQGKQLRLDEKPYEYYDKTWNGEPVLSSDDFAHLTGLSRGFVSWHFRKSDFTKGVDFYYLKGNDLAKFKRQNPRVPKYVNGLYMITKSGFQKLCTYAGVKLEQPQCFIEQKEDLPKRKLIKFPSKSMESLMGYIREEVKAIDCISYLLLTEDTKENLEAYRNCMLRHLGRIRVLSLDVKTIII